MKGLAFLLLIPLLTLQFRLWVDPDGVHGVRQMERMIEAQREENGRLAERNRRLQAEVTDLKEGLDAIESRARRELGLIGKGETFYQFVED